jgi:hypothetical protein
MSQQIIQTVVNDLKTEGQRILPTIIDSIKEVASDENLTGRGKLDFVANKTIAIAPDIAKTVSNNLINLAYAAMKADPSITEVQ